MDQPTFIKIPGKIHTGCGGRVYEGYVMGRTRGDVGRGFREFGEKAFSRSDYEMNPRPGLTLSRVVQ